MVSTPGCITHLGTENNTIDGRTFTLVLLFGPFLSGYSVCKDKLPMWYEPSLLYTIRDYIKLIWTGIHAIQLGQIVGRPELF